MVAVSVVLMGQGQSKDKIIEAERIVLKDASGRLRATIGPEGSKNGTMLEFCGKDGNRPVGLGILVDGENGMGSTFWLGSTPNPKGADGGLLAVGSSAEASFSLFYGKGKTSNMGSLKAADEGVLLTMSDEEGNVGSTLASGKFALGDKDGHPRAGVFLAADGSPNFQLFDKKSNVVWHAP
jgi:hypothetical protein